MSRQWISSQLAFYVNLHRAVIGPSATLTGRWRPDIDLRRMLTGLIWLQVCLGLLNYLHMPIRNMHRGLISRYARIFNSKCWSFCFVFSLFLKKKQNNKHKKHIMWVLMSTHDKCFVEQWEKKRKKKKKEKKKTHNPPPPPPPPKKKKTKNIWLMSLWSCYM